MADRFLGVEFGADLSVVVTEGSSSTAARDVEVRITTGAAGASKLAVLNALDVIRARIEATTWPPA